MCYPLHVFREWFFYDNKVINFGFLREEKQEFMAEYEGV